MLWKSIKNFLKKPNKRKIRLGICAMDKKAKSKPMSEILDRLPKEMFEVELFGDDRILNQPVETWPVVDVLITFYSTKFPTEKALEYIKLRKPFLINDLEMDTTLKDRRKVYNLLKSIGIDVPTHVFVNRDEGEDNNVIEEFDDYIVVNGVQINKPLVEKPVDAEDHNIHIYYPASAGGGAKHLFRKIGDRSSEFFPDEYLIRRDGSFIYEEFVITQGTDVKVYTVGPDYAHAEARKSPVVDGKVQRDSEKKEVRYPVILSPNEKDMARRIVQAFKQRVCGFDILRVHGKSYCCDVNGFSFVKNSRKYYEDAAKILTEIMITEIRPDCIADISTRVPLVRRVPAPPTNPTIPAIVSSSPRPRGALTANESTTEISKLVSQEMTNGSSQDDRPPSPAVSMISDADYINLNATASRRYDLEELRCVIAVIRHGDRTPKQKIKLVINEQKYLDYFQKYCKNAKKDLKVKSKSGLIEFLKVTIEVIQENKYQFDIRRRLTQIRDVLERWEISGINRKLQMKPQKWDSDTGKATELLVILKWGGDLTPLGRMQAEELGKTFCVIHYPDNDNGGVLRLHATYRHDLKIKASDEGRVMKTAAAFAKGLLELEGQLTPILASLVTIEDKNRLMLDRGGNSEVIEETDRCKKHLNLLQVDQEIDDNLINEVAPGCSTSLREAFIKLGNPLQTLKRMHYLIGRITSQLEIIIKDNESDTNEGPIQAVEVVQSITDEILDSVDASVDQDKASVLPPNLQSPVSDKTQRDNTSEGIITPVSASPKRQLSNEPNLDGNKSSGKSGCLENGEEEKPLSLYLSETFELMLDRWEKLHKEFYSTKTNMFDLTKVPDVYDMIRYDVLHNFHLGLSGMEELFRLASNFDACVVPQEYGIDREDKRFIGAKMCGALLEKIKSDLIISSGSEGGGMANSGIITAQASSTKVSAATVGEADNSKVGGNNNSANGANSAREEENTMLYKLDHSHAEDLQINSLQRCVRTRLYFTSESHLQTILNVFRSPKTNSQFSLSKETQEMLNNITNVSYLSQFIIRLFEDRITANKFHCELSFSSGVTSDVISDKSNGITPYITVSKSVDLDELVGFLDDAIDLYHCENTFEEYKEIQIRKSLSEKDTCCPVNDNDGNAMTIENDEENKANLMQHDNSTDNSPVENIGVLTEENVQNIQQRSEDQRAKSAENNNISLLSPKSDKSTAKDDLNLAFRPTIKKSRSFTVQMDDYYPDSWEKDAAPIVNSSNHHFHSFIHRDKVKRHASHSEKSSTPVRERETVAKKDESAEVDAMATILNKTL